MDLEKFIRERPYLYHLTSASNAQLIIEKRQLFSTNELLRMAEDESVLEVSYKRRVGHYEVKINGASYFLRDQRPISEKALAKCLTDNWSVGDFLHHLNDRVFMWPTLDRLWKHFTRYEEEKPVIFRFPTQDLIALNPHVLFCRLNSGATRANSYLGGKPPSRGAQSFLPAASFDFAVRDVAEVTFPKSCNLGVDISFSTAPEAIYKKV